MAMKMTLFLLTVVLSCCATTTENDLSRITPCDSAVRQRNVAWATNESVFEASWTSKEFNVVVKIDDLPTGFKKYFVKKKESETALMASAGIRVVIHNDEYFKRGVLGSGSIEVSVAETDENWMWSPINPTTAAIPSNDMVITLEETFRTGKGLLDSIAASIGHPVPYGDAHVRAYSLQGTLICEALVVTNVPYLNHLSFVMED